MEAKTPLLRVEDRRLLTGQGRFVDDVHLDRMVHAAFVRSPHAHAEIASVDVQPAMCPIYMSFRRVQKACAERQPRFTWTEEQPE